jgi:hypothetical protein
MELRKSEVKAVMRRARKEGAFHLYQIPIGVFLYTSMRDFGPSQYKLIYAQSAPQVEVLLYSPYLSFSACTPSMVVERDR